jgi:WS/DGAT/MGAT family acyltransferase
MLRRVLLPVNAVRDLRSLANEVQDVRREIFSRLRAAGEMLGATLQVADTTPINQRISPHRRLDWFTMDLDEIKSIRRAFGCSINDVVLTVVTGIIQRFLERRQVTPSSIDFRVMAPVSVRTQEQRGTLGNQVSAWIIELPLGEPDPKEQLRQIQARTTELKNSRQAVGAAVLTGMAEWTSSTLLALGARNMTRFLPFNLVVTNVPGPQLPIYMLGARMLETFPLVPLVDNMGLCIAQMSYAGKLFWGFNGDYDLVPDLAAVVKAAQEAFEELKRSATDAYTLGTSADEARPSDSRPPPLQIVSKA